MRAQAEKTRSELKGTFEKKQRHFSEKIVTFLPVEEGVEPVTEEQLELQTSIRQELSWISGHINKALDTAFQVAVGNTVARADVVLEDGEGNTTTLLKDIPATSLLELEKRVKEIHDLVAAIPTLDPTRGFREDPQRTNNIRGTVYRARDEVKPRTKKIQKPMTLAQATDKHPAQVQLISEDVLTGRVQTQEWSGLITPAEKGDMLDRVETLARAVKRARSRANDTEVDQTRKIGRILTDYVFKASA